MTKTLLSSLAMAAILAAQLPYLIGVLKHKVRPHVFSWVIWGITTLIVFFAQTSGDAGVGAWGTGVAGVMTILIAIMAFKHRGDITITRTDWLFFILALLSIPFWYFTADPLWAVVILTSVDLMGFIPTLRKIYHDPYSEPFPYLVLFVLHNVLVLSAMETYSVTTILFPLCLLCTGCLAILVMRIRRRELPIKSR